MEPTSTRSVIAAQVWRRRLRGPRLLAIVALLVLIFLEQPRWCVAAGLRQGAGSCRDPAGYHTFGWGLLDRATSLAIEAAVVLILAADLSLWGRVRSWVGFSRPRDRAMHSWVLALLLLDVVVAMALLPWYDSTWRPAPYLRVLLLTSYSVDLQICQTLGLLRRLGDFVRVLLPLIVLVLLYSWSGVVVYASAHPNEFGSFGKALWSMTDLVTTNNYPDVMVDIVEEHRINFLFFFIFLVLSVWLLLPAVAALICSAHQVCREEASLLACDNRERLLDEAFTLLDAAGSEELRPLEVLPLFTALHEAGGPSAADPCWQSVVFALLDRTGRGALDRSAFAELPLVLSLILHPVGKPWLQRQLPRVWSCCGRRLSEAIGGRCFEYFMCLMVVASLGLSIAANYPLLMGLKPHPRLLVLDLLNIPFAVLLLLEGCLKILLLGWDRYIGSWTHRFDAFTTLTFALALTFDVLPPVNPGLVQLSLMLCACRVLRLGAPGELFLRMGATMSVVTPKVLRVLPSLACALLFAVVLGVDLFGGLVTSDPRSVHYARLSDTAYAQASYWPLNFNDAGSSTLVLISCLVVNNSDKYVAAYMAVSGNWASIYFLIWFFVGVCAMLNLVMYVAIEVLVAQGMVQGSGVEQLKRVFEADVVTGTPTGVKGPWRAVQEVCGSGAEMERHQARLENLTRPEAWHSLELPDSPA